MKKYLLLSAIFIGISSFVLSQSVGIGTVSPNSSAQLDITNTSKGLLIPRMTTSSITSISNPAKGLMVYDSIKNQLMVNMGSETIPNWQTMVAKSGWNLTGNSSIDPSNQFIGNTDNQPLRFRINNTWAGELHPVTGNVFLGLHSGQANTTGQNNIAIGTNALKLNTYRNNLVAVGDSALFNNGVGVYYYTQAINNTAIGSKSLYTNTTGGANTACGAYALYYNSTGFSNTANGTYALYNNYSGEQNTANGESALYKNISGFYNTAVGSVALYSNTSGSENTACGQEALFNNTTGNFNTACGYLSLLGNTSGSNNIAIGYYSLAANTAGSNNTGIGASTLYRTTNSQYNTALGYYAGSAYDMGYNNTILGANCDVNAPGLYNCIAIGQQVICTASSQARIGNSATNSIGGYADWTNFSDGRYKKNVQENVKGIDFIMKLRPITYNLDVTGIDDKLNRSPGKEVDAYTKTSIAEKEKVVSSGFIAQEVEKAAKELGYDFSGVDVPKNKNDFYGLRYSEFVVPLVKAFQEEHAIVQQQQSIIDKLQKEIEEFKIKSKESDQQQQQINDLVKEMQLIKEKLK